MGDFVLAGSAQFDLMAGITQSLAGRVGRVELLPLCAAELGAAMLPDQLNDLLLKGGYPALYDRPLAADDWLPNYVASYLERDVRQLLAVRDLTLFQRFVRMCAARSGQLLNLAGLGADCGISAVMRWPTSWSGDCSTGNSAQSGPSASMRSPTAVATSI